MASLSRFVPCMSTLEILGQLGAPEPPVLDREQALDGRACAVCDRTANGRVAFAVTRVAIGPSLMWIVDLDHCCGLSAMLGSAWPALCMRHCPSLVRFPCSLVFRTRGTRHHSPRTENSFKIRYLTYST